ncbi:MAG: hypothetical protein AB1656_04550 [Candidatus Omnitrophota bacterium]
MSNPLDLWVKIRPQAAGQGDHPWPDLISLYRFADNDRISIRDLRTIRAQMVCDILPPQSDVMVAHDVSVLDFSHQNAKTDRRWDRGPSGCHSGNESASREGSVLLGFVHDLAGRDMGTIDVCRTPV